MWSLHLSLALGLFSALPTVSNAEGELNGLASRCKDVQHACLSTFVTCDQNCDMPGTRGFAASTDGAERDLIPLVPYDGYTVRWQNANPKYPTLVTVKPDPSYAPFRAFNIEPLYITARPGLSEVVVVLGYEQDAFHPQIWRLIGMAGSRLVITVGQPEDPASAHLPNKNVTDTSNPFAVSNVHVFSTTREFDVGDATQTCNSWWDAHVHKSVAIGLGVGIPVWTILILVLGTLLGKHLQKTKSEEGNVEMKNLDAPRAEERGMASDEEGINSSQKL